MDYNKGNDQSAKQMERHFTSQHDNVDKIIQWGQKKGGLVATD